MKLKLNTVIRSFVIFVVLYFSVVGAHLIPEVRKAHTSFYTVAGQLVMNCVNPNIFCVMNPYIGPIDKYDITVDLYDKSKFKNLRNRRSRAQAIARFTLNREFFILGQLPLIFLLSLIIATPIAIKRKLIAMALGTLMFYIYLSLYLSYDFEQLFKGQDFQPVSFWEYLIRAIGEYTLNEHILLVALLIWGVVCFTPTMMKKVTSS